MDLAPQVKLLMKIALAVILLWLSLSFAPPLSRHLSGGRVVIRISHVVGDARLQLDTAVYKNSLGQEFKISKFKYYLGHFILKQNNGATFSSADYYLVNEEEQGSKQLVLENVPAGDYASIEFLLGVDSLHNCSGAQSGALDPANAMFWAWNTGYIFMKLEGSSAFSKSPGHFFEYHIGGYRQPANCIKKINLALTGGSGKDREINLRADVLELLKEPVSVDFEKLSSVTDSRSSTLLADNYKDMFSIDAED